MTDDYQFDPDAWSPALAGTVAGAVAAIVAALVSLPLRSPDEVIFNSLTVVVVALVLGTVSGVLWRRLRATRHPIRSFGLAMAGGLFMALAAIAIGDVTLLGNSIPYATPLAVIIFITLGFLTPVFATVTVSPWIASVPIVIALALGVGLFGRGNVASGDLTIDDAAGTAAASLSDDAGSTADISLPDDLAASYTVQSGVATYSVEERLQGLSSTAVGKSESITGTLQPGAGFLFTIDLQSFASDQSRRDSRVREWFAAKPEAMFKAPSVTLPEVVTVGTEVPFDIEGTLEINGIPLSTGWTAVGRIDRDGVIAVVAETDIVLSDFEIPVVDGRIVTMSDGAHLEVALSLVPSES